MPKMALMTGRVGFIGSYVAEKLFKDGCLKEKKV